MLRTGEGSASGICFRTRGRRGVSGVAGRAVGGTGVLGSCTERRDRRHAGPTPPPPWTGHADAGTGRAVGFSRCPGSACARSLLSARRSIASPVVSFGTPGLARLLRRLRTSLVLATHSACPARRGRAASARSTARGRPWPLSLRDGRCDDTSRRRAKRMVSEHAAHGPAAPPHATSGPARRTGQPRQGQRRPPCNPYTSLVLWYNGFAFLLLVRHEIRNYCTATFTSICMCDGVCMCYREERGLGHSWAARVYWPEADEDCLWLGEFERSKRAYLASIRGSEV